MSTTTTTTEAEGFGPEGTTEAEASVAALNTTVDDAVNALTAAIEAAETVVAKFGMTIVRNKAPHFILEESAESPRKRPTFGRHFSDNANAAAVGAAADERAASLASATEGSLRLLASATEADSDASIAEAVTAAAEAAVTAQ